MSRCIRAKLQSLTSFEWNNKRDNESGRYLKESSGNEVVVVWVWVCDTDREEHYVGRRRWEWMWKGEGREEYLREDGWVKTK